jgi:maltodextrin utilization protein YvdJ
MPALLAMLFQNGLGILGNALLQKGQEVVEAKLGVKLEPNMSSENILALKQLEFQHEEWLVTATQETLKAQFAAVAAEDVQITDRWKADMASDSWWSKNVRPIVLMSLLIMFGVLALLASFGYKVDDEYLTLLKEWGMLALGAYFGGRSYEKVTSMKVGAK